MGIKELEEKEDLRKSIGVRQVRKRGRGYDVFNDLFRTNFICFLGHMADNRHCSTLFKL